MLACPAWATSRADSLLRVLGGQPDDSAKVHTLNELFNLYVDSDSVLAKRYAMQAYDLSKRLHWEDGIATACANLGAFHAQQGQVDQGIAYYNEVLGIHTRRKDSLAMARTLEDIGEVYFGKSDFKQSAQCYERALSLYQAQKDTAGIVGAVGHLATIKQEQGDYSEAQQRLIQQLNLEHAQDQLRIVRSRQGTYVLFAGIFLFLSTAIFLYFRIRQNKSQSLQIAIKNKEIAAQRDYAELQALRILQINSNLEQLVATRTVAVVEAKRELDIFLYESAHALRRPLTRISALVELVNQEQDPQQAVQFRRNLALTLQNMDDLLHKLIMVNESSRREPLRTPVDLGKLLQACIAELHLADKAEVVNRVPVGTMVKSDAYFLHSVLVTLLENAVSFHPDSANHRALVELSWEAQGGGGTLRVYDNGSGVPPDQAEKVFDMFYRGTVKGSGQGLGLYIARKSAERIGAQVKWLPGTAGATFALQLP